MKQHEKRAVERAIEVAKQRIDLQFSEEDFLESRINDDKYKKMIAREAVKIAELRAHRTYDFNLQQEVYEYALAILS